MKKILTIAIVIATLTACQKSEEQTTEEVSGASEVFFTSDISTRATGTSWDAGDQIGVSMFEEDNTYLYDENALYTISEVESGAFTSSSPLLYPSSGATVDFMAYHPYTADYSSYNVVLNTADQSSEAKIKAQDFMVARAQGCSEESTPSLSFSRKMSKIVINVTRKESKVDALLSDISLSNVKADGTFFLVNGLEGKSVSAGDATTDISMFFNETSSIIEVIVIPQELSSTLNITIDGVLFEATISGTFAEDTKYSYNIIIGADSVEFTAGTITSWSEEPSGEIGTTQLPSYTASELSADMIPETDL